MELALQVIRSDRVNQTVRMRGVVQWGCAGVEPVLGIIIRMFVETGSRHHVAHFHAYYQNEVAIFSN